MKTHRRSGLLISKFALQKLFRYLINCAGVTRQNRFLRKSRFLSHSQFPRFFYSNILAKKSSLSVYIFGFFLITVILSSFSSKYLFKVFVEISNMLDTSAWLIKASLALNKWLCRSKNSIFLSVSSAIFSLI